MANEFEVVGLDIPSMFAPRSAEQFVSGNKHWDVPDTSLRTQ